MAKEKNKTLKEAGIEMNYLTGDEEVRRRIELREKWEMDWNSGIANAKKEGREEGINEGRQLGINEERKIMVKEMYKNNLPMEVIIKVTRLTKEEVEKILKDNE